MFLVVSVSHLLRLGVLEVLAWDYSICCHIEGNLRRCSFSRVCVEMVLDPVGVATFFVEWIVVVCGALGDGSHIRECRRILSCRKG